MDTKTEELMQRLTNEIKASNLRNEQRIEVMEKNITKLSKLLMGNGEVGMCERVRTIQKTLIPLWTLVSIIGTALIAGLIKIFIGG